MGAPTKPSGYTCHHSTFDTHSGSCELYGTVRGIGSFSPADLDRVLGAVLCVVVLGVAIVATRRTPAVARLESTASIV